MKKAVCPSAGTSIYPVVTGNVEAELCPCSDGSTEKWSKPK